MLIARLIADPDSLATRLETARDALLRDGFRLADARLLEFNGAVMELAFPDGEPEPIKAILGDSFAPCDLVVSKAAIVTPQVFVSDMDSTIIGQECIDELADFAGLKDRVSAITERAMRGELDFEAALRERVGLLAGLEESAIERCLAERISPEPGARDLIDGLKQRGVRCVLVTGGFHHFADAVADQLGFDRVVGNRLAVQSGRLTGELVGPICTSATKQAVLAEEAARLGDDAVTLATGDGANDIPMLQAATYGFAYRAKPQAKDAANGQIERGSLADILELLSLA